MEHEQVKEAFSDYYDRTLPAAQARAVEEHLGGCPSCRTEYDTFKDAVGALSGLHKMAAPGDLEQRVEDRIHKRSAGRFFGRKAFGDRVPFEAIALAGLALAVIALLFMRGVSCGDAKPPVQQPGATERIPTQ
jgi:anti-sigma factor RsiW